MQNSTCAAGASHSHSSSTSSSSSDNRVSIRSFSDSISSRRRGQAPSSFIDTEASPSNTLSTSSSQEDPPVVSRQLSRSRSQTRDSLLTLGRISIVSTPRPTVNRRSSTTASAREEFGQSHVPWSQKSALKRMSWGWNQTFAGLTPQQLTEIEYQRGRAKEVKISKRPSSESRPSTATSEHSNNSAHPDASTITPKSPTVNKPFANRRPSIARPVEISLPPVTEEEVLDENAIDDTDEMGLGRAFTKRFNRMSGHNIEAKERPVIGLPTLISTTNAQITEAYEVHPALRDSTSSAGYSNPSIPGTPNSERETPGLTDSSSIGSSRSSTGDSPMEGRFDNGTPAVSPNHLTQYFPQPTPDKVCDNVVVVSNNANDDDVFTVGPAPALPSRAPSHSKHEHERVSRTRSLRLSTGSGISSRHTSASTKQANAFTKELTQLEEVQEDFNGLALEETKTNDERVMGQGFRTFTPSVYMLDLADMEATRWVDEAGRRSIIA